MSRQGKVLGTRVPDELMDRVHDAVLALGHLQMTKVRLVLDALEAHCKRLEKRYNEGKPFPSVKNKRLGPGRKINARSRSGSAVGKRAAGRVGAQKRPGKARGGKPAGKTPRRIGRGAAKQRR